MQILSYYLTILTVTLVKIYFTHYCYDENVTGLAEMAVPLQKNCFYRLKILFYRLQILFYIGIIEKENHNNENAQ
jgi:hypothetical protein